MATVRLYLDMPRTAIDGFYPLVILVTHHWAKRKIATPYCLSNSDFNKLLGKIPCYDDDYDEWAGEIKRYCAKEVLELESVINSLTSSSVDYTASDIVSIYQLNRIH